MAEIKRINGTQVIDYTARDYDSLLRAMRELIPDKMQEWTDYESEADFGNVLLQLFAHMGDILSYYQDRIANENFLGTARERRSVIQHLRLIGYSLGSAAPASTTLDLMAPPDNNDVITVHKGAAFATKSQQDKPSVRFEYTGEDLKIDFSSLPIEDTDNGGKRVKKKIYRGLQIQEGRLIRADRLGRSSGKPNQRFSLSYRGLMLSPPAERGEINRDLILTVDSDSGWKLQETLAFSRGQKDYAIEIDENDQATVVFGDGMFGEIPPKDAEITASYRIGGGAHGNVGPETIKTIVEAPELTLISAEVTNPDLATGGAERESIEHAVLHAPQVFRSLKRAVTSEDYETLARNFSKAVGKVRAEPKAWNTVVLYVAPQGGGSLSDVLKADLLAYFEDKRPITTLIEIGDVDYVSIYVSAEIGIESYYSPEDVKVQVATAARLLLAFDNVDFGEKLFLSKFYEAIEAVDGVQYVNITEFRHDGQEDGYLEPTGKIKLGAYEIPRIPEDERYASGIRLLEEGV